MLAGFRIYPHRKGRLIFKSYFHTGNGKISEKADADSDAARFLMQLFFADDLIVHPRCQQIYCCV